MIGLFDTLTIIEIETTTSSYVCCNKHFSRNLTKKVSLPIASLFPFSQFPLFFKIMYAEQEPEGTSYQDERADARGGAMEELLF